MNRSGSIVAAALVFNAVFTSRANAGAPKLTVAQIVQNGRNVPSVSDVTLRTLHGRIRPGPLRRGQVLPDDVHVEVPSDDTVSISAPNGRDTLTLHSNSNDLFQYTGTQETISVSAGKTDVEDTYGFFSHVNGAGGIVATAPMDPVFSIAVKRTEVAFSCTRGAINITRSGYLAVGAFRKAIALTDVVSATGEKRISYPRSQVYLATFPTYDSALSYYQGRVIAARRSGDRNTIFAALSNLGYVYEASGKYGLSLRTLRQALALTRRDTSRDDAARALLYMSFVQEDQGNYSQALASLHRALDDYDTLGDVDGQARSLNNIGIVQNDTGEYSRALQSLRRALSLFQELGDRNGEARAYADIAIVHERQHNPSAALQAGQRALAMFREAGDRDGEARAFNNMGIAKTDQESYNQALQYFAAALALHKQLGDGDGAARALSNVGMIQEKLHRYADAQASLHRALSIFQQIGDKDGTAGTYGSIAHNESTHGSPRAALALYDRALNLFKETGDRQGQAAVLYNVGLIRQQQGKYGEALQSYRQALVLYRQLKRLHEVSELELRIATLKPSTSSPVPVPTATPR